MKKILITLLILTWSLTARSGLIFDNGSGGIDDTFCVQFYIMDSDGRSILTDFDTVYVIQAYQGSEFHRDTIYTNTNVDLGDDWPATAFFEKRYKAADISGHTGAYTWYVLGVTGNNYHTPIMGNYYVNDEGLGDFLTMADTTHCQGDLSSLMQKTDTTACRADVSGLSTLTDTQVRDAIGDSCGSASIDYTMVRDSVWLGTVTNGCRYVDTVAYVDTLSKGGASSIDYSMIADSLRRVFADSLRLALGDSSGIDSLAVYGAVVQVLEDSTAKYQGEASGLTAGQIASAVGDTVGRNLTGNGTEPETLLVLDPVDSTRIENARLTIRTLDGFTVKVDGCQTDVNGRRVVELDPGSYYLAAVHNNYRQLIDTITVVTGGGSDTLFMTMFDPGHPAEPDLCRVYGWIYDISGSETAGAEIAVEIPRRYHPVKYNGCPVTPYSRTTTADSSGFWYIDLLPSAKLTGDDVQYRFTIKYNSGVIYRTQTEVPDSLTWQLK